MNLLARRPPLLPSLLLVAVLLRVACAAWMPGFDHPNEQYRLLEPIAAMDGYSTRLPWEWTGGLLSELPARAFHSLLTLVAAIGITSATAQAFLLRALLGALGALPVLLTWRWVLGETASERIAALAAASAAIWPDLIYRSSRLMDYSLEASLLAGALLLLAKRRHAAAGIALGASLFVRPQSGLALLAVAADLALRRKRPRDAGRVVLGYAAAVAVLGIVEHWLTGAGFLSPFFRYLKFNFFEGGAARLYGSAPWHRYLSELLKFYGFSFFLLLAWLIARGRRMNLPLLIFALALVAHTLVAHKEGRFLYGFCWLLIPAAFAQLKDKLPSKRWVPIFAALFVGAWVTDAERVFHRDRGAGQIARFVRLGETLRSSGENRVVRIDADPDFLPGAFFLRYRGPLCYQVFGQLLGDRCPRETPPAVIVRGAPKDWVIAPPGSGPGA